MPRSASPHRGVKGQVYEGGTLVPGLIEWPARIPQPRRSSVRASTSDLLPTLCALVGQPLPDRPLDGVDLTAAARWQDDRAPQPALLLGVQHRATRANPSRSRRSIPNCKKGTTPLVKLMGGKATRDFTNFRHPAITDDDYLGPRAIIDGRFKLVIHEQKSGDVKRELFDLQADPAEKTNLFEQQPQPPQINSRPSSATGSNPSCKASPARTTESEDDESLAAMLQINLNLRLQVAGWRIATSAGSLIECCICTCH